MKTKKLFKIILLLLFSININAQVPSYVPTNGLVGWYPFTGNANDLSGNGNNGTNNGATLTTDRFANTNSSYNFNNNYIITSFAGFGQNVGRAFSLWTNGTNGSLLAYGGQNDLPCPPDGDAFQIIKTGNLIEINVDCSSRVYLIPNYSSNAWYHFVFSFPNNINNLNGVKVYCNSNLLNVNSTQGNGAFSTILNLPVNFGRCHRGNNYYNGKIDDIGIWNRALNECEIKQLYNTSVLPSPTVIASTSNSVICIGGSAILTASTTATTYTWNTGATTMSISVSPSVTSTYTITGTNTLSCVASAVVTVTVNAPLVSATTSNSVICIGGSAILTASTTATTYTWNTGATTMSISVSPTVSSTYTVIVSNAAGCANTSTVMVKASPCGEVGINELSQLSAGIHEYNDFQLLSIFPNPSKTEINITTDLNYHSLFIVNTIGQVMLKKEKSNTLSVEGLSNGVYFIQLLDKENKVLANKKFIKE